MLLLWPGLEPALVLIKPIENTENRALATKPVFDVTLLDPFPTAYEKYYNDHFPFRNHLAQLSSWIDFFVFNKELYEDRVIVGKNNVMFPIQKSLNHMLGKDLMKDQRIDSMRFELLRRKQFLDERNIAFIIVIAPEKYSVMPDPLPNFFKPANTNKADQFAQVVQELNIPLVDLRAHMADLQKNDREAFYFKYDSHWNYYGAFIAYQHIMQTVKISFPQLPVLNLDQYALQKQPHVGGNLVDLIAMRKYLSEEIIMLTPQFDTSHTPVVCPYEAPSFFPEVSSFFVGWETTSDTLPRLMVVRDSFTNSLIPYLKESFGRSVFIWDGWHMGLNVAIVENEKPDIYMLIVLESLVNNIVDFPGE
jgi:hypothetical protein